MQRSFTLTSKLVFQTTYGTDNPLPEEVAKGRESFSKSSSDPQQPGKTYKDPVIDHPWKLLPAAMAQR